MARHALVWAALAACSAVAVTMIELVIRSGGVNWVHVLGSSAATAMALTLASSFGKSERGRKG